MNLFKTALVAIFLLISNLAFASEPPIKIISAFPVGSGPDVVIRKVAERLSEMQKRPVVIETRPGGNGAVSLQAFKASTEVDTLYFGDSASYVIIPAMFKNTDLVSNLEALSPVAGGDMVLISSPSIQNFEMLVNAAKKNPSFGSWGVASAAHLNSLIFLDAIGSSTNNLHIPYKDYGAWFTDTSNQQLTFGFATVGSTIGLEKAGKIKFQGITENSHFKNIVTIKSQLKRNVEFIKPYSALFVNASMPANTKQQYISNISTIMSSNEIKNVLAALNYTPTNPNSAEFSQLLVTQNRIFRDLIARYNIQLTN
jgi:tripartite-type tricarboxylate transporter receptor subunit TctC